MFRYKFSPLFILLISFFIITLAPKSFGQSVTRGYGSDDVLQRGMIVGLQKTNSGKVQPVDLNESSDVLGVVVNQNDSPITVSDDLNRIFVASSGKYDVLVSDQNGSIPNNSYISLSAVAGIGMRASDQQSTIIGRALQTYDGKSGVLATISLKESDGQAKQVKIARIKVDITIGKNPLAKGTSNTPAFLSQAGQSFAGKPVSAVRLYLGALVFLVGLLAAFAILYSGIRSSITAIGRNPLGKRSIYKSLFGVSVTALFVFIVSIIAVYLLLKL